MAYQKYPLKEERFFGIVFEIVKTVTIFAFTFENGKKQHASENAIIFLRILVNVITIVAFTFVKKESDNGQEQKNERKQRIQYQRNTAGRSGNCEFRRIVGLVHKVSGIRHKDT